MKSRPRTASATFFIAPTTGRAFSAVSRPPRSTPFRFMVPTTVTSAIAAPTQGSDRDARRDNRAPPQRTIRFMSTATAKRTPQRILEA